MSLAALARWHAGAGPAGLRGFAGPLPRQFRNLGATGFPAWPSSWIFTFTRAGRSAKAQEFYVYTRFLARSTREALASPSWQPGYCSGHEAKAAKLEAELNPKVELGAASQTSGLLTLFAFAGAGAFASLAGLAVVRARRRGAAVAEEQNARLLGYP